ncbi:MAG: Hint domain-containing protein, partial [Paracoccaceae bacterium]
VVTSNGPCEIKHIASSYLTDCPIQIKRGALGPGRPERDMYLAPDHKIPLQSWRSLRYYGSDLRNVPISYLRDGNLIIWGEHPGDLKVFELEFASEQVIYVEGVEVVGAALSSAHPVPLPADQKLNSKQL